MLANFTEKPSPIRDKIESLMAKNTTPGREVYDKYLLSDILVMFWEEHPDIPHTCCGHIVEKEVIYECLSWVEPDGSLHTIDFLLYDPPLINFLADIEKGV